MPGAGNPVAAGLRAGRFLPAAARCEEPIQEADLSGRSTDSLNDSVKDLVESLKKTQLPNLVGNPTLVEKNEDTNVEKTKTASNINLEEGLLSLFDGVVKARG